MYENTENECLCTVPFSCLSLQFVCVLVQLFTELFTVLHAHESHSLVASHVAQDSKVASSA